MQSQVRRRIAFGITTGGLFATGGLGFAHADTAATGSGATGPTAGGSPGVLSGNSVQIPVDIPINVCGVTANVVGVLNPAAHNECSNSGGATATGGSGTGSGTTGGSPGVLSGNNVQIPVNVPVNVCGDTVNVVGVGNAAKHNACANHGGATATGGSGSGTTGGSPGVLSGNNVQIPVHVPVNVCGDTVNVVGVGNTAKHNACANHGGATATGGSGGGPGTTAGGSPGVLSGNTVQIPITVPVNVCGDSVSVVGIGDTAAGNECENHGGATASPPSSPPPVVIPGTTIPGTLIPPHPHIPQHLGGETVGSETAPAATGSLAHTGADGLLLAPVAAALMGGGAFLVRKFKPKGSN